MSKELKFQCPVENCGGEVIEEVMANVVQYSDIESITDDGNIEYTGEQICDKGDVDYYQCKDCVNKIGEDIDNEIKLAKWLKENCKQD